MEIQLFNFDDNLQVRTVIIDNDVWFAGTDVANILGYSNTRDALIKHCKPNGIKKCDTLTNGGIQKLNYINKENLSRLITRCNLIGIMTYLIYNKDNNLYKIGRSTNLKNRLQSLKSKINQNLEIICFAESDIETVLHKRYSKKRVFGEWFELSFADVLDIKNKYNFKNYQN